ncbi:MAG: lipoyl(octanoyl) transferase LipB [Thaumarchaeota archaeon]|nr:lipoyl(octanoyl) transferase LipB [Nitrososphaerota archaeon]
MTKVNLALLDLGRRPYESTWELQKRLVRERAEGSLGDDALILVEHEHVITLGRKTTPENFKPQDIPVFKVERGGDATYHGPGQLVGYPIIRLSTPNVQGFVRSLEDVLILSTRAFGIESVRVDGHTGVWVGQRKIASIGVAVSNWVTYHGFALNVNTDLSYFHLIKPCGLDASKITSMKEELGKEVPFELVKREVVERFVKTFGYTFKPPLDLPTTANHHHNQSRLSIDSARKD